MNTDKHGLALEGEIQKIIGCAMEVLNTLGHGLLEKPYENAMVAEFRLNNIPYSQQERFKIDYKGVMIGEYVPDIIAFGLLVVDVKVIDKIAEHEMGQMLNYLRITRLQVGLLLNFKRAKLEWKRVIL